MTPVVANGIFTISTGDFSTINGRNGKSPFQISIAMLVYQSVYKAGYVGDSDECLEGIE